MVGKTDSNPLKNAFTTVKNVLIAGVLVQMSRFLVGVAFDISTVATTLVSSIPSQIISSNSSNLQVYLNGLISSNQSKLIIDFDTEDNDTVKVVRTGALDTEELKMLEDTITPSADSVI